MQILFINPPHPLPRDPYYSYPLGIASIIATLEDNSYFPKFLDFYYLLDEEDGWQKIANNLSKANPDIVGIPVFTENRIPALKLASFSKKLFPNAKIILGGPHPSIMYSQILQNYDVDAVVIGEGEVTFLEIVKAVEDNRSWDTIAGIAYKKRNGELRITTSRELIPNLDYLPMPAYHHFNLAQKEALASGIQVVFSRGCPFRCQFCSESVFWRNTFRARSVEKCADELKHLTTQYGAQKFIIYDALLSINKKRSVDFCKIIIEKEINIKWGARLRVDNVDKEILQWLKKAGCIGISYGVESGSQKILNNINKKISIDQIIRGFDLTHDAGLIAEASIMVGNPGENWKTILETDRLLKRIQPDRTYIIPTKIYPGTPLYDIAKEKGLIDDNHWLLDKPVPLFTEKLSSETIRFFISLLYKNQLKSAKRWLTITDQLRIYGRQIYVTARYALKVLLQKLKIIGA